MKKFLSFIFYLLSLPALAAQLPTVLSESDAETYAQIFELQRQEKIDAATKLEPRISDRILIPDVQYNKYMSRSYRSTGQEIINWLYVNNTLPGADNMMKMAHRKKVADRARAPKLPATISGAAAQNTRSESWTAKKYSPGTEQNITKFKNALRRGNTKNAKDILQDKKIAAALTAEDYGRLSGRLAFIYYCGGYFDFARHWGTIAADAKSEYGLWTMGLMSWKNGEYPAAEQYFKQMLALPQINNLRKNEVLFWAARAAEANDNYGIARDYWKIAAAASPASFYGALSNSSLGWTTSYDFYEDELTDEDIEKLMNTKYGRHAVAALQAGQPALAEQYLRLLITADASDKQLHAVHALATTAELPRTAMQVAGVVRTRGILEIDDDVISAAQYPMPDWEPLGGWSLDRALLFAIVRQESGFKTAAKSVKGANGVMQIMPKTAKLTAPNIRELDMANPNHNMSVGQQHIVDLLQLPNVDGNIIKMLISYNAGNGALAKFEKTFQTDDPLLFIESFPNTETRTYVKKVLSNLWLYRARLGQPLRGITELTEGKWPMYESQDDFVLRRGEIKPV
ncbi:MAG: lytic transglycosylase domain-containing protein [Rickettsiales bacterium]|nr:lytic transglycosylase domain-containing protein [Rickettsiales bacterium]